MHHPPLSTTRSRCESRCIAVLLIGLALGFLRPLTATAQKSLVLHSTDIVGALPTATGFILALAQHDRKGIVQLGLSTATTVALNYGVEALVHKRRPDGSDDHAFPSSHTSVAFDGATFLMRRYGPKWGIPAYAVATYTAWGRVYGKRHDWWDVLGGAVLGAGCALIYTRPLPRDVSLTIAPTGFGGEACGLTATLQF